MTAAQQAADAPDGTEDLDDSTFTGDLSYALAGVILGTALADHAAAGAATGPATNPATANAALPRTLTAEQHLALVGRCSAAERLTRQLLEQSVDAARSAGQSWAAIGGELGMSRQAAQQRFGRSEDALAPDERWLGPVTAFDEMRELEIAGRLGWHTVGAGMLRHRMVRTATQWEHRRLLWPGSTRSLLADGWRIGCRAFPWIYLIRDTGRPAAAEPGPESEPSHA